MITTKQFAQIKAYLEDDMNCDHRPVINEITNIQEIFRQDNFAIYQITRKVTSKDLDELEDKEFPDLLAWRLDSWEDPGEVFFCGNVHVGIRSLDVRLIGMFRDAIPDGDTGLNLPWANIPRKVDSMFPISALLEEVAEYLECNGFEAHYKAVAHLQHLLAVGEMSIDELEEEDEPAPEEA